MGRSFILERIAQSTGRTLEEQQAEVRQKTRYLEALAARGVNHYLEFTRRINAYYVDARQAFLDLEMK
jgi:hypothetical protein